MPKLRRTLSAKVVANALLWLHGVKDEVWMGSGPS